jgi:hypothetical protein
MNKALVTFSLLPGVLSAQAAQKQALLMTLSANGK